VASKSARAFQSKQAAYVMGIVKVGMAIAIKHLYNLADPEQRVK
jgi:hypothetical protein